MKQLLKFIDLIFIITLLFNIPIFILDYYLHIGNTRIILQVIIGFYIGWNYKQMGILFRLQSFWIGIHYSKYNNRLCINILPCITIWVGTKPTMI